MGWLKAILIIIALYYLTKFVLNLVFKPFVEGFHNNPHKNNSTFSRKKEGQITIEDIGNKKKKYNNDSAEDIKYTEIKD